MSKELVFVIEPDVGRVTVEISQAPGQAVNELAYDLGNRININCAKPSEKANRNLPILQTQATLPDRPQSDGFSLWLYRLYHNSTVDGPGRRSMGYKSADVRFAVRDVSCLKLMSLKTES